MRRTPQLTLLTVLVLILGAAREVWQRPPVVQAPITQQVITTPLPVVLGVASPSGERARAKVERVVDGDTIKLTNGQTVRYIGMDTPETKHPTKSVMCFGKEAEGRNRQLVEGKEVELEKDVSETDRYKRLLRYVWVDGQLINEQLVREGYGFARSYPPDIARQTQLRQAESEAREQQRGLWSACPSTP
jgi:micrococcal nuclease